MHGSDFLSVEVYTCVLLLYVYDKILGDGRACSQQTNEAPSQEHGKRVGNMFVCADVNDRPASDGWWYQMLDQAKQRIIHPACPFAITFEKGASGPQHGCNNRLVVSEEAAKHARQVVHV